MTKAPHKLRCCVYVTQHKKLLKTNIINLFSFLFWGVLVFEVLVFEVLGLSFRDTPGCKRTRTLGTRKSICLYKRGVHLWEVKNKCLYIAGNMTKCPLTRGVHLQEVSVIISGGSTVFLTTHKQTPLLCYIFSAYGMPILANEI